MASVIYDVACPRCNKVAWKDDYYKIDEFYLHCRSCGFCHTRTSKYDSATKTFSFEDQIDEGYGVFALYKGEDYSKLELINTPITDELLNRFTREFEEKDTNREKSYLISFTNNEFECLLGNYPEDFHLSHAEMVEKHRKAKDNQVEEEWDVCFHFHND